MGKGFFNPSIFGVYLLAGAGEKEFSVREFELVDFAIEGVAFDVEGDGDKAGHPSGVVEEDDFRGVFEGIGDIVARFKVISREEDMSEAKSEGRQIGVSKSEGILGRGEDEGWFLGMSRGLVLEEAREAFKWWGITDGFTGFY